MAGAVIGALRVVLGADTAALDKGLKDSQGKLQQFGAGMATAGAAVAAAMVAMGVSVALAVRHSITEADKLGKMSQKIGIPVEQLSALSLAAALSDVSMESLGKSVGKLSKAMVEAAAKPTSDAANAFKALGVTVTESDGKLKSSNQVISDIAGKFEGLKDGAGKTAVAMALFGKSGAEMIPLLNSGKAGLKDMTDEAARLGIVIDTHTAKSAEAFNDNLTRLGKVKDGIILKITVGMLPALQNLSANMVRVAKDSDGLKATGEAVGAMMTGLFSIIQHVSLGWQRLGVEWAALREFMKTDIFSGKLTENWKKFTEVGEESRRQFEALRITMENAHLADAFGDIGKKAAAAAPKLGDLNYQALAGKNAIEQFIDSQKKSIAGREAEFVAEGMAAGAKERLKVAMQGLAVAQANSIVMSQKQTDELYKTSFALGEIALKLQGQALISQAAPAWKQYSDAVANANIALANVPHTAEEAARVGEMVAARFGMTWQTASASIAGSITEIGGAMAGMNKSWARAVKVAQAIAAAQALVSTLAGAADALKFGFPQNLVFSAAVLAKGMALVAAIKGAAMPSMALGGSFTVPGGSSMTDNMTIPLNLASGERVRVDRPDNAGGGSESGGGTVNLTLNGRGFGREEVRELLDTVQDLVRDGYKLNLMPGM